MSDETTLTEEDRIQEELVAYLDGELDDEASERVIQRLRSDPNYRQKLNEMQAAWDMLDELPRVEPSDSFTQSTIEMIALTSEADALSAEAKIETKRHWSRLAIAAAVLVAALLGYYLISQRLDRANRQLVRDLPVIENVDLYSAVDDLDFLRELEASRLFDEEPSDGP
jgi:anti-sigma factor RsiW